MNDSLIQEPLSILHSYYLTEPTVKVNAETWSISFTETEEGILFYACSRGDVGAKVLIPHELWVQLNCGLKIAYAYNCVLCEIERMIKKGVIHYEA